MKYQNRVRVKEVVSFIVVLCVALSLIAAPDKDAKSADNKPAASEGSPAIVFKSPADASTQYTSTNSNVAIKNAAKNYLQQIVDRTPRDPANYSAACAQLVKILSLERQYDKVIQLCLNQLADEQVATNIYTATLSLADAYVAINDQPKAEKALDEFLQKNLSSDLFPGAWAKLIALYQQQRQPNRIIQLCAKYLEKETDPKTINVITATLSGAYAAMGDYPNAAKVLDTFLEKNRSQVAPANVVTAVKALSSIYAAFLGQPKEAVAVIDRELKYISSTNTVPQQADLMNAKAEICYAALQDLPAAAAEYRKIIDMGEQVSDIMLNDTSLKLAQVYKVMGQTDQAVQALLDCLKKSSSVSSLALVQKLIDLNANEQQLMDAVWILREKVAVQSANTITVEQYQSDIVKLLVKAGKSQEALQEARVFLYTCSDKAMPVAIDQIAWIFKTSDLNLARANTFLRYQKYGPGGEDAKIGTDDDLADVLKDVPSLSDERRTKMFKDLIDNLPKDWMGYQKRGDVYLYLDQPVEAFQAYRKSFELCPMTDKDIQAATDSLTDCIIRITRDVPMAELLVQYIMLGPAGTDGKLGTADDIKDPTPEIIKKIQYTQQQRVAPAETVKAAPAGTAKVAPAVSEKPAPAKQAESEQSAVEDSEVKGKGK